MHAQLIKRATLYIGWSIEKHILKSHPSFNGDILPHDHTIVTEGDFQTSTKNKLSSLKVTNMLCHQICITCGDANIEYGSHMHADPFPCLYTSINHINIMSNKKQEKTTLRQ